MPLQGGGSVGAGECVPPTVLPRQLRARAASAQRARAICRIARADNHVYSFNAIVSLILSKILSTCHKMINSACFQTNRNFPWFRFTLEADGVRK